MRSLGFVLLLTVALAACRQEEPGDDYKPAAGATIVVETGDADAPARIMQDVNARLARDTALRATMLSHGYEAGTSYGFKFRGRCSDTATVTAIKALIARSSPAPATCRDG